MFNPWVGPWFGIALIIGAIALLKYVRVHAEREGVAREEVDRMEQRLGEIERRLTDIQDIVLAIDEKLEREERQKSPAG